MLSERSKVNNILVISLTNIGDVVLTFPVIDILKERFMKADISVIIGPKAESLLENNPVFKEIIIYDKNRRGLDMLKWVISLRKKKYDCVIDLRHTAIPLMLMSRYRTRIIRKKENQIHMRDKHLNCLKAAYPFTEQANLKHCFFAQREDKAFIDKVFSENNIKIKSIAVIVAGAANPNKRYTQEGFSQVCDNLINQKGLNIVFVGDKSDAGFVADIQKQFKGHSVNLCGVLSLVQVGEVMNRAEVVITNDTGPMHLASYLNKPIIALFGPTSHLKYGPWSNYSYVVKSDKPCLSCQGVCSTQHTCMSDIHPGDIIKRIHIKDDQLFLS